MLAVDLNNFFLKSALWIKFNSDLLKCRVALWGFCGVAATAEYNEIIEGNKIKNTPFVTLAFYTCAVEIAIWLKFFPHMGYKLERKEHPNYIYMDYAVFILVIAGALKAMLSKKSEEVENKKIKPSQKQD